MPFAPRNKLISLASNESYGGVVVDKETNKQMEIDTSSNKSNFYEVEQQFLTLREKRSKPSYETPRPKASKHFHEYDTCDKDFQSFIPISKDHVPFVTFRPHFDQRWGKNKSMKFRCPLHQSSSKLSSYNQGHQSLPQGLFMPIL